MTLGLNVLNTMLRVAEEQNVKGDGVEQIIVRLPPQLRGLYFPHTPKGMTLTFHQ